MDRKDIYSKLNEIFEDVLDLDETPNLTDSTSANDIEAWDSLSHVQIVVAVEKAFKIKFKAVEMISWDTVGEMVDCILSKI